MPLLLRNWYAFPLLLAMAFCLPAIFSYSTDRDVLYLRIFVAGLLFTGGIGAMWRAVVELNDEAVGDDGQWKSD